MFTSTQERVIAISRMFSSAVLQELARRGRSPLFSNLLRATTLSDSLLATDTVGKAFDLAFARIQKEGLRDEYIYKSALVRRILVGRHSLRTASLLREFRVGECKADLAILNGTSTVYEVKSERDSLVRLERQMRSYCDVFARAFVVTAETHISAIEKVIPQEVGIMRLNKKFQISIVRDASDSPKRVSPLAIFDSVRTEEARLMLSSLGIAVPQVPNTERSMMLREYFSGLTSHEVHRAMVEVLKKTRTQTHLSDLLSELPRSLHSAALSVPLRKLDHARLVAAVNTPVREAMAWG